MTAASVALNSVGDMALLARRRLVLGLLGAGVLAPLAGCGEQRRGMGNGINLSVVLYAYLTRSIFDIFFNGDDLGVSFP